MELLFILVVIAAVVVIYNAAKGSPSQKSEPPPPPRPSTRDPMADLIGPLRVRIAESTVETTDGKSLPCHKVTVSGTCSVPYANYPCNVTVMLADTTDKSPDGKFQKFPVLCSIPELADENGFWSKTIEITLPYEVSAFEDMPVLMFFPDAMVLPKKGKRNVEAIVVISARHNPSNCLKSGIATKEYHQKDYGYMEVEKREIEINTLIAKIAVAASAADGHIEKTEEDVIRNYFTQHFARLKDPENIQHAIETVLKKTIDEYRKKRLDVQKMLDSSCRSLIASGKKQDAQAAFELAVRVVAADGQVKPKEQEILKKLANSLEIAPDVATSFTDKHFSVSMFGKGTEEAVLNIPPGLSKEKKIEFLKQEYKKYLARVNHKDPKIRMEAEMRIQTVTRMRKKLG